MRLRNKRARKVYTLGEDVHIAHTEGGRIEVEIVLESGGFAREYFDSLAEFNGEWEDVKEPLIKDEKIRKAVRAWAEASDVGVAKVAPFAVFDIESSARIYFYGRVIEDKDYDEKKSYIITELCGEDEECES